MTWEVYEGSEDLDHPLGTIEDDSVGVPDGRLFRKVGYGLGETHVEELPVAKPKEPLHESFLSSEGGDSTALGDIIGVWGAECVLRLGGIYDLVHCELRARLRVKVEQIRHLPPRTLLKLLLVGRS